MLFSAGEGGGKRIPKLAGKAELVEQIAGDVARAFGLVAFAGEGFGDDIDGGHAGDDAQKLGAVEHLRFTEFQHLVFVGGGEIEHGTGLGVELNRAGIYEVGAVNALHERALAGAGFSGEAEDIALIHLKRHIVQGGDVFVVLDVKLEVLRDVLNFEESGHDG